MRGGFRIEAVFLRMAPKQTLNPKQVPRLLGTLFDIKKRGPKNRATKVICD